MNSIEQRIQAKYKQLALDAITEQRIARQEAGLNRVVKPTPAPKQKVKAFVKKTRYRRFQIDSIDRQMDYAIANDKS